MRDILRLSKASDDYSPSPYILWATLEDGSASHLDYMGNPMPNHKEYPIGGGTSLLLPEQIDSILRRDSASLTAYYRDAESLSNRMHEYWSLSAAQTVTSADVSISEDDLPKLLKLLQSEKTLDLTPAALPICAPSDALTDTSRPPPGKDPSTSVGKLAVKAAWIIECKQNRRATDKEVMSLLQDWADKGSEPAVLKKSQMNNRCVIWTTDKCKEKTYTLEACQRALRTWNKSRQ